MLSHSWSFLFYGLVLLFHCQLSCLFLLIYITIFCLSIHLKFCHLDFYLPSSYLFLDPFIWYYNLLCLILTLYSSVTAFYYLLLLHTNHFKLLRKTYSCLSDTVIYAVWLLLPYIVVRYNFKQMILYNCKNLPPGTERWRSC